MIERIWYTKLRSVISGAIWYTKLRGVISGAVSKRQILLGLGSAIQEKFYAVDSTLLTLIVEYMMKVPS